jgi:hypothetical protein
VLVVCVLNPRSGDVARCLQANAGEGVSEVGIHGGEREIEIGIGICIL